MKKIILYFLFLSFFSLHSCKENKKGNPEITVEELKSHILFLASDEMKGRGTGTLEGKKSASYIRDKFKSLNLKLLYENGFQHFDVTNSLKLISGKNSLNFEKNNGILEKDFYPISFSKNGTLKSEVVFCGYGLDVNEDSVVWNDYENIDVKGKIAMILRGEPEVKEYSDILFNFSSERSKALTAKDKGAKGVIFVSGEKFEKKDKLKEFYFDKSSSDADILVVQITRNLANKILKKKSVGDLEKFCSENKKSKNFATSSNVDISVGMEQNIVKTQNVVALLEGADENLKNEFIVIGGHYDHLGMGGEGSGSRKPDTIAVHNGADDNASGIASILEIAEKFANQKDKPKRSIIFIAFGAEEIGLIGSKFFVKNPPVDLKKINAMINLDMIGCLDTMTKDLTVGGIGTAKEWDILLKKYSKDNYFNLQKMESGYGPSDHASFFLEDISVLYFFTGVHDKYHTPADDIEIINFDGLKHVANFAFEISNDILRNDKKINFIATEIVKSEKRRHNLKVKLSIVPDFSGIEKKGMRVDAVVKGGIAEKYGLLKGDIIISMENKKINNIHDYMNRLKTFKVGDRITIGVMRNEKKMTFILDL